MNLWRLPIGLFLAALAPAATAQPVLPPSEQPASIDQPASTGQPVVEAAQGLTGEVSDESEWRDLQVAIASFATDEDVATPAGPTSALGRQLAEVIGADLTSNGLFRPSGPAGLPLPAYERVSAPEWLRWRDLGAEMLVQGYVRAAPAGRLTVGCYLYDVALGSELARQGYIVAPSEWRRAAHKCADMVYARLSGEQPFLDSRIAYIAESGPKDRRVKRLAVMDSDGANHRFITNGQAIALTPRYSPDYRSILYLSYAEGRPSILVHDVETGRQRLVSESANPTFAPRWSPDGRWILYAMAVAGNTDIYRVPATGGPPQRLTDSPGIDVGGSYSPDGSRIVFESDRSGSQQVYVMNADGSGQRRISFLAGRAATPEWSPRGDQIAFTHIAGNFRIAVMSPSGGGLRFLTDSWQDESPTWAPNGRIVQFFRTERGSGRTGIWQVDLTGRHQRRLPTPFDASDPAWGPVRP